MPSVHDAADVKCRRLEGKVAVVTASTAGIGLAIATRLGQEGASVVVSSRKSGAVDAAVSSLRGMGIECSGRVCHVGNRDHRRDLVEFAAQIQQKYGRIDVLVSNATVNPAAGGILDLPESAIDKVLDINIKAAILLVKEAVPHMSPGASVLMVSSITAFQPMGGLAMYAVSKTALLGLVKALAMELGAAGIRVNGLAPGIVPTKFAAALAGITRAGRILAAHLDKNRAHVASHEQREEQARQTVLGRLGTPEEQAASASFLCSDDARYITGETLVVAGGARSRL